MKKIRLDTLGISPGHSKGTSSFAIVLGEQNSNRRLPIVVGMLEAQAIAIEMEKIRPSRPMTHDLFISFANAFSFSLHSVLICDMKEGIYYAEIIGNDQNKNEVRVDARPSDAIAIALRFKVPVYIKAEIFEESSIEVEEVSEKEAFLRQDTEELSSVERLEKMLEDALRAEDYEQAAKIRDKIKGKN